MEAIPIEVAESLEAAHDAAERDADDELARRARSDLEAFGELYVRHREPIFRYLRSRCASEDDALELTAVTFEKALRAIHRYRPQPGGLRAWLVRIARNAAIDAHRRARPLAREAVTDPIATSSASSPEESAIAGDERRRIRSMVAALPDLQRDAVALRYAVGLTAREIGLVIGKSEEATQKLLSRAVAQLKETYRDQS
jgi:RNA polymerase sigma-70 factor (ECF subfamily)